MGCILTHRTPSLPDDVGRMCLVPKRGGKKQKREKGDFFEFSKFEPGSAIARTEPDLSQSTPEY
jgi:hypothetical protein